MLTTANRLTIAGEMVYRDDEVPHQFYVQGEIGYVTNRFGQPKFILVEYRWPPDALGSLNGGLLMLSAQLALPTQKMNELTVQLKQLLANENVPGETEPAVSLIPYTQKQAVVSFFNQSIQAPAINGSNGSIVADLILPITAQSAELLSGAIATQPMLQVFFELCASFREGQGIAEKTITLSSTLPPLSTLQDAAGSPMITDPFIVRLDLQSDLYFHPLEVDARVNAIDFQQLGIDYVTLSIQPDGGAVHTHDFHSADEPYRLVAPLLSKNYSYRYWVDIHKTGGQVHSIPPVASDNAILTINIPEP